MHPSFIVLAIMTAIFYVGGVSFTYISALEDRKSALRAYNDTLKYPLFTPRKTKRKLLQTCVLHRS